MKIFSLFSTLKTKKNRFIAAGLLITLILTFISLAPTINNGFFNLDDPDAITENNIIKSFNPTNLKQIFTGFTIGSYHPLTTLSFAVEYHFTKLNPKLYHINNLILHLLNIILVYWLIFLLTKNTLNSFIVAILFGIHPLHVESIAWITERKDVLFSLFYLSSLITYIFYTNTSNKRLKLYIYTLIFFILSLLSKPAAVTLPIIFILFDYYSGRKFSKTAIIEKIPCFALSIIFGLISLVGARVENATDSNKLYTIFERFLIANFTFITYIAKLLFPYKLSILYPYPQKLNGQMDTIFLLTPIITIILVTLTIKLLKHSKDYLFGLLFYFFNIALVLQFFIVGQAFLADRFTYLPSIGIFFIISRAYTDLNKKLTFKKSTKYLIAVIFIIYIAILSLITFNRSKLWKDSATLWTDTIYKYPYMDTPYTNRGTVYELAGKHDLALKDFYKAIEINPNNEIGYNNIGYVYQMLGEFDAALNAYSQSIKVDPYFEKSYSNRGTIFLNQKKYELALKDFDTAIALNPFKARSFNNKGLVYKNIEKFDLSITNFTKAIEINPDFVKSYFNRATVYEAIGQIQPAVDDYTKIIEIDPLYLNAYINRGIIFTLSGSPDQAIHDFTSVLYHDPSNFMVHNFLGVAFGIKGNKKLALESYKKAKELNPNFAEAYNNIGTIYADNGQINLALNEYNNSIKASPNLPETYNNRGLLYQNTGNLDLAIKDFTKAIELSNYYALAIANRSRAYSQQKKYTLALKDATKAASLGLIIDENYIQFLKDNTQ